MQNVKRAFILFLCGFVPLWAVDVIQVDGNEFVNEQGETMIFRGLNTSDPDRLESIGMWNDDYFQEMANWGANVVRFPVHPRAWRERGEENYLELLDQGIELAKKYNLYVIIDWHSIGNLRQRLFQHPMYETTLEETYDFWRKIAFRYRDEPIVAFFELYNEPTVIGDQFGDMTWEQWKVILNNITDVIRAYDDKTIVLVSGFNWAYDLTPIKEDPLDLPNVAYVSHPYPQKREQPWEEKWEQDWGFVAEKYPLILTEIGFSLEDEPGAHIPVISTVDYAEAITKYCEKKGISWVAWVFDTEWSPMMISDWNFSPTTQGQFFRNYLQSQKQ